MRAQSVHDFTAPIAGSLPLPSREIPFPIDTGTALLRPTIVSTEGVEPHRRLDMWRSYYASFFAIDTLGGNCADFSGRKEIWSFGPLALTRNRLPNMMFAREDSHIRRDSIDHWMLRIGRSGQSRIRSKSKAYITKPGVLSLLSLGEAFEGDREEVVWTTLHIPRDSFPVLSDGLATLGSGPLETPGAALLGDYMLLLEQRLPEVRLAEIPVLVEATRSMIAACLLAGVAPEAVSSLDREIAARERIRRVVRRNISSSTFSPTKLCRLAGVSRSRLYRLLEPQGGAARYIQIVRLRVAHAMLSDPESALSIAQIGERLGFCDASTFSRAFRHEFGYTPGEARSVARSGLLPDAGGGADVVPGGSDFGNFLRRLGSSKCMPLDDLVEATGIV